LAQTEAAPILVLQPARFSRLFEGLRRAPVLPLIVLAFFLALAIFADVISPYSSTDVSLRDRLTPPFWHPDGNMGHPLGTDPLGRDLATRTAYGARTTLIVAASTVLLSTAIGVLLGLIAGYNRGFVDTVIMRAADITIAFPIILFAIMLVVILGPGIFNLVVAVGVVLWARFARVIRGEVLIIMERDFIARARVAGCSSLRIIVMHLFPNIVNTMVVLLTLQIGFVIIIESSLSFLGAGVPPPTPAWGSMIAEGRDYTTNAWWVSVVPGVALALIVISFNLIGDWLREALDPRQRQV
jgi:peptide/nickel transport system permease protein